MSKLKLLLLGGIFTLVGIFNFSSAKTITFVSDGSSYTPNSYKFSSDSFKNLRVVDFSCGGGTINSSNGSTTSCFIKFSYGGQNCEIQNGGKYDFTKIYNYCGGKDFVGDVSVLRQGNSTPFSSITFEDGQFDIMQNGLTPAVEGVKLTVNQIIPLIVFIGIGVLVVTLGFIAIRWLVNWLGGKIKSVFISKRG